MNEELPPVLFVIVPVEEGPFDVCERCGADLFAGDVWTVASTDGDLHELTWVMCGECWSALARTWWEKTAPTSSPTSSPWPSGAGGSVSPGWAPKTAIDGGQP